MRSKRVTIEEVRKRLFEAHGNIVTIKEDTFKGTHEKAVFIDRDFGEWEAIVKSVMKGGRNPKRYAESKKFDVETVKKKISEVHGNTVRIKEETYTKARNKATFIDKDFGEWECTAILVWRGHGHPHRGDLKKRKSFKNVNDRILKEHNSVVSMVESSYKKVTDRALFVDRDFGEFENLVNSVLHGVGHPARGRLSNIENNKKDFNEIKLKLFNIHGGLIDIKESTYVNTHTKCVFIDKEQGEFSALPTNVLYHKQGHPSRRQENYEKTCMKIYGVKNASQNLEVALKSARATTKRVVLNHWKTGEELVCIASYEVKTVSFLNANRIDYKWQPQVFNMPNGRTYRPDLFLINENKWIEIKGYMRPESKPKWDWFKTQFPTAELWDEKKLKEMGIL